MLNPLFDAMNHFDDNIIVNAQKTSKKPMLLRVGIIAAAVAILTLGVGFAAKVTGVFGDGKDTVGINSHELAVQFNLKSHKITIPEEFKMRYDGFDNYCPENMKPSELFAKFGVSPLLNDNFAEDVRNNNLSVTMTDFNIEFAYIVRDKKLNAEVYIRACYDVVENISGNRNYEDKDPNPEVVTLNDGSFCIVTSSSARFAYDGVFYHISNYGEEQSHDEVKQILIDLGVL